MQGTYRFYQDGQLVAQQKNLITTEGEKAILRYMAGHSGAIARSLAVGTGQAAPTVGDTKLAFEVARAGISVVSPDYVAQSLVFKATLPQNSEFAIWEIGALTVAETEVMGKMLLTFDSETEVWSSGAFQADTSRIGADALRINAAASATTTSVLSDLFMDTSDYLDSDRLSLAYIPQDANLNALKIRLKTDDTNYFEHAMSALTAGYKIETWAKSDMTITGTPVWDSITAVDLVVTAKAGGATNVDFDGLRIDHLLIPNNDYALVSRTVLGAPVIKTSTSQMDIEYTLDVTI
jgi:hypothetical protein